MNTHSFPKKLRPAFSLLSGLLALSLTTAPTVTQPAVAATKAPPAQTMKPSNSIGDKWAVVIGCSKFGDARVPVLKYSAKDAQDFADYLTDPTFGKFKKDHVKVLTNEEATKVNIMDTIGDSFLPHAAMPGDLVVIYLSTHGSPAGADIRGVNYVVAFDTQVDKLYATGIEMKQLLRVIKERVHTDRILLVMDTCYSGAGAEEGHKGIVRTNIDANEIAQGCGSLVISSSSPSQRAWESDKLQNSFFTHYLIDSMKEGGGQVTIDQAFDKMKTKVQEGVLKEKGEMQTPIMSGVFKGPKLVLSVTPSAPHDSPFTASDVSSSSKSVTGTATASNTGTGAMNLPEYAEHMHEAKGLESKHKFWEAAHELELSMKANPGSVEAYLAAAQVYDSQGRYDKSLEAAKHAVLNDDNSSAAHEQLGLAYFRSNYGSEALRQAQLAVTKDPQNSMAHNLLGFINEHNNNNDLAEQEYREALSLNAVNVRALVNLGLLLQKQNRDSQQAEDYFRKAIAADSDDWQAHLALAKTLYAKKDYTGSEEEIKKAVASDPSNPDLHREYANLLSLQKDHYEGAENEYRKAIEMAPNNANAHQAFADFLCKRNRTDEAEKEYKAAITSDPNAVAARVGLGNLLLARKSYDDADVLFKKALAIDMRNAEAHVGLAIINAELYHNYAGAQDELKKALTFNDKLASAHEKMGEILYRNMNRPSDGKIELEKAIAIDPNLAESHFQLGMLLADAYKPKADEALAELQKAVSLDPNSARYEAKLGWWQSQNFHEFKDAEKHYRRAIELNNSCSEAHFRLGLLMVEKFGLRKSGDEELRIAYQQDPTDPEIKAAFARFVGK